MKVIAINGSPHKDGNTSILIGYVFRELEKAGIQTEMVHLAGLRIRGCMACFKCGENLDKKCAVKDDPINGYIDKMLKADGIILASPTYFTDVTAEMKALIDRTGMVAKLNADMFRRKVGAAVIAVRRGGAVHAFDTINHFFFINQMVVPGSRYWNIGMGMEPGAVEGDEEGIATMKTLGENMAWLLKKIHV
jgi:multimeric flavodoxin WrbA